MVLAALINAAKVVGKDLASLKVVINGAGAAGIAIARLLRCISHNPEQCIAVQEVIIADSKGIIHGGRTNLNAAKKEILAYSNPPNVQGTLGEALKNADVFIGVSKGNLLKAADVTTMAKDPIIFAIANPIPEIMPDEAYRGGAAIVGTGRSDLPNQVNNVLGFPGIFRGALDARAAQITAPMKLAAAYAIAEYVDEPQKSYIIPHALNAEIAQKVAQAVASAA